MANRDLITGRFLGSNKTGCRIEGCDKPFHCLDFCLTHYARNKKHGSPFIVAKSGQKVKERDIQERFENNIEIVTESGCWIWTGKLDKDFYGYLSWGRHDKYRAHRYAYEKYIGKITDDLYVCHKCDVTSCCNPKHLFLGTTQENTRDMVKKGRQVRGSRAHFAKLNECEVKTIKEKLHNNIKGSALAKEYNISDNAISRIKLNKTWRDT